MKKEHLNELKENFKGHIVDLTKKLRTERQQKSKNNRYKIVNCLRSQSLDTSGVKDGSDSIQQTDITILDVEADTNGNKPQDSKTEEKYVYDLYYTSSDYFGETELEEKEHIRYV